MELLWPQLLLKYSLFLVSFAHFLRKNNKLRLEKINLKLSEIKKIITVGMSSFINEMSNGIIVFIFNIYFIKYGGDLAVSAYEYSGGNLNFLIYLTYKEPLHVDGAESIQAVTLLGDGEGIGSTTRIERYRIRMAAQQQPAFPGTQGGNQVELAR